MTWPTSWSTEYVTIIPKVPAPENFDQCRNISCTNYLSKVFKAFVLDWARELAVPGHTQFGGEKGCGPAHFLIESLDFIYRSLEDNRASVILKYVDYSKAFSGLSHLSCLEQFAKKGASSEIIKLLSAFLGNRSMKIKLGSQKGKSWCPPKAAFLDRTFSTWERIWSRKGAETQLLNTFLRLETSHPSQLLFEFTPHRRPLLICPQSEKMAQRLNFCLGSQMLRPGLRSRRIQGGKWKIWSQKSSLTMASSLLNWTWGMSACCTDSLN